MRMSDWSSDVCSSDLSSGVSACSASCRSARMASMPLPPRRAAMPRNFRSLRSLSLPAALLASAILMAASPARAADPQPGSLPPDAIPHASVLMFHRFGENTVPSTNIRLDQFDAMLAALKSGGYHVLPLPEIVRSEEHTSELQSLMRLSYAVFCLKK